MDNLSSANESEVYANILARSFNRAKRYANDYLRLPSPEVVADAAGEYLMEVAVGTPATARFAIADTGSSFIWIQCPCDVKKKECIGKPPVIFNPEQSTTYNLAYCSPQACPTCSTKTSCDVERNVCTYTIKYADGSSSEGDIAREVITLGSETEEKLTVPAIIGCGHTNKGIFGPLASGMVGLGGGEGSLIRLLESSIQGKFAFCLVKYKGKNTKPSKLFLGDKASVTGFGVVTTPLVQSNTFYYATVEAITVGNKRFPFYDAIPSEANREGNILIDSGALLTYLPDKLYNQVEAQVRRQSRNAIEVKDPEWGLCFQSTKSLEVPGIMFHFSGADVELEFFNYMIKIKGNYCLAFMKKGKIVPIYGNLVQNDFLIGYDLERKTVSFKRTDCTKEN